MVAPRGGFKWGVGFIVTTVHTCEEGTEEGTRVPVLAAHYLAGIKQRTGSHWTNHFNTIGINGMNEALLFLFGEGIAKQRDFAVEVLEFIKVALQDFQPGIFSTFGSIRHRWTFSEATARLNFHSQQQGSTVCFVFQSLI